jgi:hypothetical protein
VVAVAHHDGRRAMSVDEPRGAPRADEMRDAPRCHRGSARPLPAAGGRRDDRGMRRPLLAALAVLAAPATAHADDRDTVVAYTARVLLSDDVPGVVGAAIHAAQVSWERPAPAMPPAPGHRWRWSVVPEIVVGRWYAEGAYGDPALAQFGGRVALDFAQREQGLLRISGYGGFYLSGRAGARSDGRAVGGGALGAYLQLGDTPLRCGFEAGATAWQDGRFPAAIDGVVARTRSDEVFVGFDVGGYIALRL